MRAQPGFHLFGDALRAVRRDEAGGADLDGAGAAQHEFKGVRCAHDAADADDRQADGAGDLPDHAQRDRLDRRAGEAAGDVGEHRAAALQIDGHANQRVDQRQRIRAGVGAGFRHDDDVGDIGRELDDQRLFRGLAAGGNDARGAGRISAEGDATVFDVRARDVDFQAGDFGQCVEARRHFRVFADIVSEKVGDAGRINAADERQLFFDKGIDADVLQADGVEHAGGRFGRARRRIAGTWARRQSLGDVGADFMQVDVVGEFLAVAEGAGSGHHRIAQADAGEIDGHVEGLRVHTFISL
mgnify:CR=1 FL=1